MDEKLNNFEIYQIALEIGEDIWKKVNTWDSFGKSTIGIQIVRSADSIAANISEGYGRFTFKERKRFCMFSRGSAMETQTWLIKAKNRNMIPESFYEDSFKKIIILQKKLNGYIRYLNKQINENK